MPFYREPRPAPRGPEPSTIEATRRANARARLDGYRVPKFSDSVAGYRTVIMEGRREPEGPYTPVQQGMMDTIKQIEGASNVNGSE